MEDQAKIKNWIKLDDARAAVAVRVTPWIDTEGLYMVGRTGYAANVVYDEGEFFAIHHFKVGGWPLSDLAKQVTMGGKSFYREVGDGDVHPQEWTKIEL